MAWPVWTAGTRVRTGCVGASGRSTWVSWNAGWRPSPQQASDWSSSLMEWWMSRRDECGWEQKQQMWLMSHIDLEQFIQQSSSVSYFLLFQVKRRHRVNGEISKIFRYVKSHGKQPGRHLFCLPSGLASFTSFALRLALEDQLWCSGSSAGMN